MRSGSSPVKFFSPKLAFEFVAIKGAPIFAASLWIPTLMHCSSTTTTSGIPALTNLICFEMGPTIFAAGFLRVTSNAVQQIPPTSISSNCPVSSKYSRISPPAAMLWPIRRTVGFLRSNTPAPISTKGALGSALGN